MAGPDPAISWASYGPRAGRSPPLPHKKSRLTEIGHFFFKQGQSFPLPLPSGEAGAGGVMSGTWNVSWGDVWGGRGTGQTETAGGVSRGCREDGVWGENNA